MKLHIITKSSTLAEIDILEVTLPTPQGTITVLENHTPIVSTVVAGIVSYRAKQDAQAEELAVFGGIVEITNQQVRLVVDDAAKTEDISEAEADAARQRAEELIAQATDQQSLEEARRQLSYTTLKLKVAARRKRRI